MKKKPSLVVRLLLAVELITVLCITVFVGYIIFGLVFGKGAPNQTRAGEILSVLNAAWKPLLILIIPLFYRPVTKFIDELQELGPAKRQPPLTPQQPIPSLPEERETK